MLQVDITYKNRIDGAMCKSIVPASGRFVFESKPRQTVVKTGGDSSTAKRSAIGMSFTSPKR